ncbi:MAG: DUF4012 domain-containing protein [Chloroflexi bacterium]|nr:DUF4012 domain-containing protein [Chloroflexota bacterium]
MQKSGTTSVQSNQQSTPSGRLRNPAVWLIIIAIVLFLLWGGLKGWRIASAVNSLQSQQTEIETLLAGGLTQIDPNQAEEMLTQVRNDVITLKKETAFIMPLTPYLGWVPKFGPTLVAAPALIEMADVGTETAVVVFQGLKPALTLLQQENNSEINQFTQLIYILDEAEPQLIQAGQSLDKLAAARTDLGDISNLPWRIRTLMEPADNLLPIAQDGLQIALILPEMMGVDEPHSYLIMIQNEDEIRPTGGFISGAGLMQVQDGRIVNLTFQDSNKINNINTKPYDYPPQPYQDFMGLEYFLYRDANFWPDFPTSAETAIYLYSYGLDLPEPDGAIAIDQQFLKLLLQAIGPISIPDSDLTLTQKNIIRNLQEAWTKQEGQNLQEWVGGRKSFLSTFGAAIQNRIESGLETVDPSQTVQALHTAAETKHLQIYMRDPEQAAVFDALDWDGRLQNKAGQDFLAAVDTNMGFNKVNLYLDRSLAYDITLNPDDTAQAKLTMTYTNNAPKEAEPAGCLQDTIYEYRNLPDYLELADECYWNYLRIYTPGNSVLLDSSRHIVPAETLYLSDGWDNTAQTINEIENWTTFANFFMLPQQESIEIFFNYTLPNTIIQPLDSSKLYQLQLNTQPGTQAQPVQVNISLPAGAKLLEATPTPISVDNGRVQFNLILDTNKQIRIVYQ